VDLQHQNAGARHCGNTNARLDHRSSLFIVGDRRKARLRRIAGSNKHASEDNCAAFFQWRMVAERTIAAGAAAISD
jgi:hypothetical protein